MTTATHGEAPPLPGEHRVAPREVPPLVERLLIIGLDGATFDVLNPLMAEGRMPRLAEAVASGASGVLRSTTPPITPAAWTTFLTGLQPGAHGIIDFERYDPRTNRLLLNSTRSLDHVRNLWALLSERGLKVGSVNVPMTYPPTPVNGFLVSGFETPGADSDFVYPAALKGEILARWPDPTLRSRWRRKAFGGDKLYAENVAYMARSFHQGAAMTTWLGDRFGWDVLMVVLKLVDNLQHKTWRYLDPRWAHRHPRRTELARECFAEADRAVGELLDYARRHGATVLMVSDHGHGSLEGKVQPNRLLAEWGYLALRGAGAQGATRWRRAWDRLRGGRDKFAPEDDVLRDLAVDFSRTRACVMHAGMAGFLYLNLCGRQPTGIVPVADYEPLRDELRRRLLGPECQVRDPQGRLIQLFEAVHKPEELYGCTREEQPWMPDLLLIPRDALAVVRKIRGRRPVEWLPYRRIEGTHRADGILIGCGPGIAGARGLRAHIVDCAPTILAMLGLRVPANMQGRVLTELAARPLHVERCAASSGATAFTPAAGPESEVFSDDDLKKVTARLMDLGYLE
ncbi:MAG: alkaline phosphatase family protein [Planctomycetes bacterium]|nr:alkaline phosphatase family protein [Planctomycetota bacterium]